MAYSTLGRSGPCRGAPTRSSASSSCGSLATRRASLYRGAAAERVLVPRSFSDERIAANARLYKAVFEARGRGRPRGHHALDGTLDK